MRCANVIFMDYSSSASLKGNHFRSMRLKLTFDSTRVDFFRVLQNRMEFGGISVRNFSSSFFHSCKVSASVPMMLKPCKGIRLREL
jgi:hypothetical protein